MNTYSTTATARLVLGNLFNTDDFLPYLNQAIERITNGGLWKGSIGYASFRTVENTFTLPYPFLSVIGAQWFRSPVPVFGQMHDFMTTGPGQPIAGQPPEGIVEDIGDGYATSVDPLTAGSTLLIKPDLLIDSGKVFRFYGLSNGREIFDVNGQGMNVTVNYPSSSEATVFDTVTGIQVPTDPTTGASAMVGGWSLYAVAPDSTQTLLNYYYPSETRPSYRRYRIGVTQSESANSPDAVTVLVRRRFMPVAQETDWVIPGNLGALKFAIKAIQTEAATQDATALWGLCYGILNEELHATRGSVRPEMSFEILGGGASFNNVF